jgi:hypothetical protein
LGLRCGCFALWIGWLLCLPGCLARPGLRPAEEAAPVAAPVQSWDLEDRLPADTAIYARMDLAKLLEWFDTVVDFVDPDGLALIRADARRAWDQVLSLVGRRGFRPKLFERLLDLRIHLVGLDQPRTGAAGDSPPESGDQTAICLALVVECGRAAAVDFLEHVKADLERRADQRQAPAWTQLEMGAGELIRLADDELRLGWVADSLVVALECDPHRLWAAMQSPGGQGLGDTERYGRFGQADPPWFLVVDLHGLGPQIDAQIEQTYQDGLRSAQELPPGQAQEIMQTVESVRETMRLIQRLLSVDRLEAFGARLEMQASPDSLRFALVTGLAHGEPLSSVVNSLFDGGRAFQVPVAGLGGGLSMLGRIGVAEIYTEVVSQLKPELHQQLELASAMVQGATGYGIADLVRLFSGDMYLFTDLAAQDSGPDGSGAEAQATTPRVQNLLLFGIHDFQATRRALDKVYEALSAIPMIAPALSRRDFMGRELVLLGPPSQEGEGDPTGALALGLLDAHLAVGNWSELTDLIRRGESSRQLGDDLVAQLVARHRRSNILVVVTQSLVERFERLVLEPDSHLSVEQFLEDLRTGGWLDGDDPVEAGLRESLRSLANRFDRLGRQGTQFAEPGLVLFGRHRAGVYDLVIESELRRHGSNRTP